MEKKLADKIKEMRDYVDELERSLPSIIKLRKMMSGDLKCDAKIFYNAAKSVGYIHEMTVNVNYSCIMYILNAPLSAFDNDTRARRDIEFEITKDKTIVKEMFDVTYPILNDFAKIDATALKGEIATKTITKYIEQNHLDCGELW